MRRWLVAAAAALMFGGCAPGNRAGPGAAAGPPRSTTTLATTTTAPTLDPAEPYVAPPNEIEPAVKTAAARVLQAIFSYRPGEGTVAAATARLAALPVMAGVAEKAAPLLDGEAWAESDIVYPQLGGLTPTQASVMTVVRLRSDRGRGETSVVRTFDVRLEKRGDIWTVVDLPSLGGDLVEPPAQLSPSARRVLDHRQIELPDTARWDIYSGRIADRLLDTLAGIADVTPVAVTVLSTGHPIEVFGSTHTSNHIPGRGVDLWRVGAPIIDQRAADGPLRSHVDRLLAQGVTELGAPFDVDGPRGANFANTVHQDHLHVAFDRL